MKQIRVCWVEFKVAGLSADFGCSCGRTFFGCPGLRRVSGLGLRV